MATAKKGSGQIDQKAKVKLIAASALLFVAVVWIIYYATTSLGGPSRAPIDVPAEQAQQIEDQHAKEFIKVKEEADKAYPNKKPPEPSGS